MHKLLAKLPPFALPFVTRSLRGGRGQRYALFSLLAGLGTLLLGLWLSFSPGRIAQNLRVDLDLEQDEWTRMHEEFAIFAHDSLSFRAYEQEVAELRAAKISSVPPDAYGTAWSLRSIALERLENAAWSSNVETREHERLRAHARDLLGVSSEGYYGGYYEWDDVDEVAALERVLDHQAVPEVRMYRSPLGFGEAMTLVGFLAGLAFAACVTVFGPLLVGIQQAQEQHENTLAPLTGTGFTARQLALGLAAGPTVMVGIFAVPQLVLFVLATVVAGSIPIGLALLVALVATSVFLTFSAQLLGHLVGTKRTPGVVALTLTGLFGVAWLAGGLIANELSRDTAGLPAVFPTIGLSALLAHDFGFLGFRASVHAEGGALVSTLVWSVAALVYAGLVLTTLARKLEGKAGAPLSARAAALGALTSMVLINLAIPQIRGDEASLRLFFGLAGLSLPFAILLMGRIPVGDEPPRMRRIPVGPLLGEFAAWGVVHAAGTLVVYLIDPSVLHPIALAWIAWCVGVLGLMVIRAVALPTKLGAHLFLGACALTLPFAFVQGVAWGLDTGSRRHVFALFEASPGAGLIQVAITVAVPVLLFRSLRKGLGSLK